MLFTFSYIFSQRLRKKTNKGKQEILSTFDDLEISFLFYCSSGLEFICLYILLELESYWAFLTITSITIVKKIDRFKNSLIKKKINQKTKT